MQNIIFLDFDGPLANMRCNIGNRHQDSIDPVAARNIYQLCKEFDAKIVISSSWRFDHTSRSIRTILNNACVGLGEFVHDKSPFTPNINRVNSRGYEIDTWVDNQGNVGHYAIIDDSSDLLPHQFSHYVRCDVYDGLDFAGYKYAQCILQGKPIPDNIKELKRPPRIAQPLYPDE